MAKKKVDIENKTVRKGSVDELNIPKRDELTTRIRADYDADKSQKQMWNDERVIDVKAYFGIKKQTEWPFKGAAKISSGFHRISVDTVVANIQKSLFSPERPIRVAPANSNSLEAAKYVEDLHNWQQEFEYHLYTVLDHCLPNAMVESFCVLNPCYEYRTVPTQYSVTRMIDAGAKLEDVDYNPDTDTVTLKDGTPVVSVDPKDYDDDDLKGLKEVTFMVDKDECIYDGIKVNVIGGSRFFMPIDAPGDTPYEKVQRASHVIQQAFYTVRELDDLQGRGVFKNVKSIVNHCSDVINERLNQVKHEQAGFNYQDVLGREIVEVLKWYGTWEIDGKQREVTVWYAVDSNVVLRIETNIFGIRPFFPIVPFPVDESPYGESLPKIIRNLVATLDLLMSTVTNIAMLRSAPPKFFDPASGFNPSQIGNIGPNSWIPAREPARSILIPPQPEDPQTSFSMIQLLINIIERITSVNEVMQGQVQDRANTTATEVSQALVRSGVRFDVIFGRIKEQLAPMFKFIHKLDLRYMPAQKEMGIMGPETQINGQSRLEVIQKGLVDGEFHFSMSGNSIVTEQGELQKAITLFNTVGQHPYLTYKPQSIYYMLFNIVKHLNPVAMDQILPKPEEVAQLLRDRAQVQGEQENLAVQGAQGGGQAEAQAAQAQAQAQQAETQQKLQYEQAKLQMEAQKFQMEMDMKQKAHEQELRHKEERHQAEMEAERGKAKEKDND